MSESDRIDGKKLMKSELSSNMYDHRKLFDHFSHQTMDDKNPPTRIVVLGSHGVGKTALVSRCIQNTFPLESTPRRDISHRFTMPFGKKKNVCLDIVDFNDKNDALISYADGFIICYSINNRKSFEAIDKYLDKIVEASIKSPKIAIVGNKIDLYNSREVSSTEGLELAKEINGLFYETSAKVPVIDVHHVFHDLYTAIRNGHKLSKKNKQKSLDSSFESSDVFSLLNYSVINNTGVIGKSSSSRSCFRTLLSSKKSKPLDSSARSWSANSM